MKFRWPVFAFCVIGPTLCLVPSVRAAAPYGLEARAPIGAFLNNLLPPAHTERSSDWSSVKAFPNLSFPDPVGLIPGPVTNQLYVHCRQGLVYFFDNDPDVSTKTLFLDLSARTQGWDDCGLMGLAFHPQFGQPGSTNRGFFYVFYQYSMNPTPGPGRPPRTTPGFNRLSRFTVPDGSSIADPNSEIVLINQYDEDVWHNGGAMFFHPGDGFLYLSLGDEGGSLGQYGNTQRIDKGLFAGVIRIDVDRNPVRSHPIRRQPQSDPMQPASATANYYVPNDNPFLDPGGGLLEEYWCIGLRSPHRMTFDPVTQRLWLGDVGQGLREEVNLIERGGNYQWAYREGTLPGPIAQPATLLGAEKPPLYEYGRADGDNCVIGGYVYRGSQFAAELGGQYLFGDNGSGRIWALRYDGSNAPIVTYLCNMPPGFNYTGLSSFGVDHSGELYMCQMGANGQIYKLARLAPQTAPAALLSQTSAFSDLASLTPAAGLIPYDVNTPLWSDSAIKTRWMALPNDGAPYSTNEQAGFSATGEWSFPEGTVFVKHFDLAVDDTNPGVKHRLETRLLVRDTNGSIYGLTYKWRTDHSDADLLPGALTEELSIKTGAAVGTFSGQDIGGPLPGSTTYDPPNDAYTVQAGGVDIWANADQFHFGWQLRTGDFDIKVRVESLTLENDFTKAGLMARESLAANSRHVYASVFADNRPRGNNMGGYEMVYRTAAGGPSVSIYPSLPHPLVRYPNGWLRLRRAGNAFTAFASSNGVSWVKYATHTLALPGTIYFGMGVTSHDNTRRTTARFRDFASNRPHAHYYPSRQDCITCHTPVARHVLGVKTHQLNGLFTYPSTGRTDNQLRTWNHLGLFNSPLNEADIATLLASVAVTNVGATLEHRARSYLAANCAHCHRPNGVARANFDARFDTPLALQGIVGGVPNESLGIPGARIVAPASLLKSIVHRRVNTVDAFKMPPLARNTIDPDAVAAIAAWINSLPPLGSGFIGLRSEYFDNMDLTGLKLTRADETINFDWGNGSPDPAIGPDTFSVRWTGQIEPKFSETYTFFTTTDDGVRLWVDGQLLIDHWIDQPLTEYSGSIALLAGRKYDLRMEYFENAGMAVARLAWSSSSQPKEFVSPDQLAPPADGWLDRDLGGVALAGRASYTNRNFSVTASGADIWDYADGFHFVYQPLVGDGLIVARVTSLENTDGWAKAGVMMRESLTADSPHALMAITSGFGAAFQRRPVAGGLSLHTPGPVVTVPHWVKLVRTGNRFIGSVSSDGMAWTEVGTDTIMMPVTLYAGLAVTAHNNGVLGTATFTDVGLNTAPALRLLERMINGHVRLQLIGQTGASYRIEVSTNLTNWELLRWLTGTNVTSEFLDLEAPPFNQRFYRGFLER